MRRKRDRVHLSHLLIHNFLAFDHLELDLEPSTVIVGPNGAGKSTVIEALHFLLEPLDRFGRPWRYESLRTRGGSEGPTFVVGRYIDLSETERVRWGKGVRADGSLWLGSRITATEDQDDADDEDGDGTEPVPRTWPGRFGPAVLVPGEHFGDMAISPGDGNCWWLTEECLRFAAGEATGDYDSTESLRSHPRLVHVPGPEVDLPSVGEVLRPLLRRQMEIGLARAGIDPGTLARASAEVMYDLEGRLRGHFARLVFGAENTGARGPLVDLRSSDLNDFAGSSTIRGRVLDGLLSINSLDLTRFGEDVVLHDGGSQGWQLEARAELGAGSARAAVIAALGAYADGEMWPADSALILAIEEPESGVHPRAQRDMARWLRTLPRFGLQCIVVTHSPIFVDAAPKEAIRTVQVGVTEVDASYPAHHRLTSDDRLVGLGVAEPGAWSLGSIGGKSYHAHRSVTAGTGSVAEALGISPSDLLVASTFVVVEGIADVAMFSEWARRLGYDHERDVQFIGAGSWSLAEAATRIVEVAYPTARVHIVFDAGKDTTVEAARLERIENSRRCVSVLERPALERYLEPRAVGRVATEDGIDSEAVSRLVERLEDHRRRTCRECDRLGFCYDVFRRKYHKVADGRRYAAAMLESEIPGEITRLLARVYA